MEYEPKEKEILNLMGRTDFKNLSKSELLTFASKLGEIRPDVAKDIIAQFPVFAEMVKDALKEYREMLGDIINSDDASLTAYYGIVNKELEQTDEKSRRFYDCANRAMDDCSKLLDNPNLTNEERKEILDREEEILRMSKEENEAARQQEREIEDRANKKDSEKREFDWKLLGGISTTVMIVAVIGAGVLGGKFDFKLPQRS